MCGISVLNILVLIKVMNKPEKVASPSNLDYDSMTKWFGAPFVLFCAWRSFFPIETMERIVYIDNFWLSNLFLGRIAATICEVCFVM